MNRKLCCVINPEYKCKCGFGVCTYCDENDTNPDDTTILIHECIEPLKPGKVFVFKKGSVIGQGVGRNWYNGNLGGPNKKGWIPRPTSDPAKFLKVISLLGIVKRNMFYDSSQVSNLSTNKAGYIEHVKGGYILTEKGKEYLRTHDVQVNLKIWTRYYTYVGRYGRRVR
jgi:hypothetical protein